MVLHSTRFTPTVKNSDYEYPWRGRQNLPREISSSSVVISTIETAIKCAKCREECLGQLPKLAKETLVYMYVDISSSSALPTETKGAFIAALADMIADNRKNSSMVTMACESLKDMKDADLEGPDLRDVEERFVYRKLSSQPHYLSLCDHT